MKGSMPLEIKIPLSQIAEIHAYNTNVYTPYVGSILPNPRFLAYLYIASHGEMQCHCSKHSELISL